MLEVLAAEQVIVLAVPQKIVQAICVVCFCLTHSHPCRAASRQVLVRCARRRNELRAAIRFWISAFVDDESRDRRGVSQRRGRNIEW
jgi:hypothetical protein